MAVPDLGSNLVELFERTAKRRGAAPFLWAKRDGAYRPWTWQRVATRHGSWRALRARGVGAGDRVLLVAENRPEWAIADLAIMAAGAHHRAGVHHQHHRDARLSAEPQRGGAAVVSTDRLARPLLPALARAPALKLVVAMEPLARPSS